MGSERARAATILRWVLPRSLLVLLGTAAGLGCAEIILRARPDFVPVAVQVDPPVRRARPLRDETYDVKLSDGDIYFWRRSAFRPIRARDDRPLARVHMRTDADGFRNPPGDDGSYPIVVLGDSFTEAGNATVPWPEHLARIAGRGVLNLGESGAGPQHALRNLESYGLERNPEEIILAWFEGNDLLDAGAWERVNPFLVARLGRHLLGGARRALFGGHDEGGIDGGGRPPIFPLAVSAGERKLEMAFWPGHIALLTVSRGDLASSVNVSLSRDAIRRMHAISVAAGARLRIVYLPCRSRIYLPLLDAPSLARLLEGIEPLSLDTGGFLAPRAGAAGRRDPDRIPGLIRGLDAQALIIEEIAREEGIPFLDLTARFQLEAKEGAELHYPFDTHWNQNGHLLAAEVIAAALEASTDGRQRQDRRSPAVTSR